MPSTRLSRAVIGGRRRQGDRIPDEPDLCRGQGGRHQSPGRWGKVPGGMRGPSLVGAGDRLNPDWILAYLQKPRVFKPVKMMPVFVGILGDADIKNVIMDGGPAVRRGAPARSENEEVKNEHDDDRVDRHPHEDHPVRHAFPGKNHRGTLFHRQPPVHAAPVTCRGWKRGSS